MEYWHILKNIRKSKGLKLREFGQLVDVDYSYIAMLEKGINRSTGKILRPSIDILKQICDKCNYPFDKFLKEAGYIENDNSVSEDEYRLLQIYRRMNVDYKEVLIAYAETVLRMNSIKRNI